MTPGARLPWLDRLVWRFTAPVYDRLARPFAPGRAWVGDALDLTTDDRVLLLGCGTGLDLHHLPADATFVAVDRSRSMVARCRRRARALGLDCEARVADARSVAAPDRSFDAVLVHLLLSVTEDPDAVLAEASRLLKHGGRLSLLDEPIRPGAETTGGRRDVRVSDGASGEAVSTREQRDSTDGSVSELASGKAVSTRERRLHDAGLVPRRSRSFGAYLATIARHRSRPSH